MPLLDHFRPPIYDHHVWSSFHGAWAVAIMHYLNRTLPRRFLAENQIHLGRSLEADVVEFDREPGSFSNGVGHYPADANGGGTAVAVAPAVYAPPAPAMSIPVQFHDEIQVRVHDTHRTREVVAVIELVSPANKDRPDERDAFALKSLGYLKAGVGLVVADIVTTIGFNLHDEMVRVGRSDDRYRMAGGPATYAVAYRPIYRGETHFVDVWPHELRVGSPLPTVPLTLKGYGCVPLDLEATYSEACERSRIP